MILLLLPTAAILPALIFSTTSGVFTLLISLTPMSLSTTPNFAKCGRCVVESDTIEFTGTVITCVCLNPFGTGVPHWTKTY